MRKVFLSFLTVAAVLGFSVNTYGVHNLQVNGSSTLVTVTTDDTIHITGDFESAGATGRVILYYDTNANGVLDAGEAWTAKFRLIDGNFADDDTSINGSFHVIYDPVTITGRFILFAEDNSVSATVPLQVNPISSSLSVSGTVNTPATTPHLFVSVADTINGIQYFYGTFTNSSGAYSIYLPSVFYNDTPSIFAVDLVGAVPSYYMSSQVSTVPILGAETRDFDLFDVSTVDSTLVFGTVKDNLGNPIADPVQIIGGASTGAVSCGVRRVTNTSGEFNFKAPKYSPSYYLAGAAVVDQFYPQYLDPEYAVRIGYGGIPSCTLRIVLYPTNDSICGTVYKDGLPYRYAQVDIGVAWPTGLTRGTYTKTYSDGHYVANVSQAVTLYAVSITPKSIPEGYIIQEGDTAMKATPGTNGVDFHLVDTTAVEENKKEISKLVTAQPNPFINSIRFEFAGKGVLGNLQVYDIAGNQVTEVAPAYSNTGASFVLSDNREKMPAGVYFYSVKAKGRTYEGKLIRL